MQVGLQKGLPTVHHTHVRPQPKVFKLCGRVAILFVKLYTHTWYDADISCSMGALNSVVPKMA